MTRNYHLAQVNIARAKATLDSPVMQGFVEQLEHINQLAETSPGFVWRLQTAEGDATALKVFDDELVIVNLSVWDSVESLKNYVYTGDHLSVLKDKQQWFDKPSAPTLALWWVPAGHLPTIEQAKSALQTLTAEGPSAQAFTFAKPFPAPEEHSAAREELV
ncbi:uncharacterized protein DUF3291 [Pseudomonas sp. SJZ079]|uniref:DUF3291 domain-containing protein n=1 Tax=Pseudomonas sp. SJZ079 TaxID=2572887 RepID=UPI00119BBD3D|nr:DUF3291 domain-containing protein [Pseudomonas sp. SJZ079]TWC29155.1 uncharacterized protein DUF3291 [Pseudomonas sp. SJZ079]